MVIANTKRKKYVTLKPTHTWTVVNSRLSQSNWYCVKVILWRSVLFAIWLSYQIIKSHTCLRAQFFIFLYHIPASVYVSFSHAEQQVFKEQLSVYIKSAFTFGEEIRAVLNKRLNDCHHLDWRSWSHVKESSFPNEAKWLREQRRTHIKHKYC